MAMDRCRVPDWATWLLAAGQNHHRLLGSAPGPHSMQCRSPPLRSTCCGMLIDHDFHTKSRRSE